MLKLKTSIPAYMIYGETGRYPLQIAIHSRMIKLWYKILCSPDKYSCKLYTICRILSEKGTQVFPWPNFVRDTLYNLGLNNIWDQQDVSRVNIDWL